MSPFRYPLAITLGLFAGCFIGCSPPVKPPTAYDKWAPEAQIFHLEYPQGWNSAGGGKNGIQWAKFTQGPCLIKVDTNVSSSLVGDISSSFNNLGSGGESLSAEELEDLAPVATAHQWNKDRRPDEYKGYKEEDAEPFTSGFGDSRKSPFKATIGVGRKVKGYRATALGRDRGVTVYCYCLEKDWEKFRPAYDKVLESLSPGH